MILYLRLVTPEKQLLSEEVASLTVPTENGHITILPQHAPLVATLVPGELVIRGGQRERPFHVGGGMLRVEAGSQVTILADAAEHVEEIDIARAQEALARAKERLESEQLSDREYAATAALLDRNLARLRIARKHAHRHHAGITGEGVLEE
jgi:F-type H+-transporting ATPase subunit epsilon